jgi:hypothetical protein
MAMPENSVHDLSFDEESNCAPATAAAGRPLVDRWMILARRQ